MRIAVVHTTLYRYSSPVYLEPHIIRLRPREDASQRLEAWTLDIAPTPLGRTERPAGALPARRRLAGGTQFRPIAGGRMRLADHPLSFGSQPAFVRRHAAGD